MREVENRIKKLIDKREKIKKRLLYYRRGKRILFYKSIFIR
jgi:hypothetical protein